MAPDGCQTPADKAWVLAPVKSRIHYNGLKIAASWVDTRGVHTSYSQGEQVGLLREGGELVEAQHTRPRVLNAGGL